MNKIVFLYSFLFLVIAQAVDSSYYELCKLDHFCNRLTHNGVMRTPKTKVVLLLKQSEIQKQIFIVSKRYGIDPNAIVAVILAEHSLNAGFKNVVQTFIAKYFGITNFGDNDFSFGFGQINFPTARDAEIYVAKLENRNLKSDSDLIMEMTNKESAINIVGSVIRKIQDDYKNQGFDISNNTAIIATLYNLGGSEKRAKEAKLENRTPRVNYFGFFVNKYLQEIRHITNSNDFIVPAKNEKN